MCDQWEREEQKDLWLDLILSIYFIALVKQNRKRWWTLKKQMETPFLIWKKLLVCYKVHWWCWNWIIQLVVFIQELLNSLYIINIFLLDHKCLEYNINFMQVFWFYQWTIYQYVVVMHRLLFRVNSSAQHMWVIFKITKEEKKKNRNKINDYEQTRT